MSLLHRAAGCAAAIVEYTMDRRETGMPTIDVNPDQAASGAVATGCAVCPHPWATHDHIATRYCTATAAGQFSRGCVCTAYPEPVQSDKETR